MPSFEWQTNVTRDTVQFGRNTKHKKLNTHESRERKFKKSKRNEVSNFDIYVVVFNFLLSTVEVGRW